MDMQRFLMLMSTLLRCEFGNESKQDNEVANCQTERHERDA